MPFFPRFGSGSWFFNVITFIASKCPKGVRGSVNAEGLSDDVLREMDMGHSIVP